MPRLESKVGVRLGSADASCPEHPGSSIGRLAARAAFAAFLLAALLPATLALADSASITLLHTNDIHGAYDLRPAAWLDDRPLVGGFRALAGTVDAIRRTTDPILVDAGDLMSGDPLTVIDYEGVMGGGAMAFMNAMAYDAMALGNHEFDNGRREIEDLLGTAAFPVLSANLWIEETGERFLPATAIVERAGLRVGLIGLMLDDLAAVVAAEPIRGLRVEPMVEAAHREVANLDPQTDLIVVLAHAGLDDCKRLAGAVAGIDVIVAGHDHRRTPEPIAVNGVLIVESGDELHNLGRLDLAVADDRVVDYSYDLILLTEAAAEKAPASIQELHERCHAAVQAEYGIELATLATPFERRYDGESNVGNWVTDAMREAAGADFAVTNSSGLRSDVSAGSLTRLDIHRLYPFYNLLSTFACTGEELMVFARHNTAGALTGGGRSLVQVSGLSWTYTDAGEVRDLRVGGEPVEPARRYVGATSDFVLFSQPEKYLGFVPAERERTTAAVSAVLAETAARQREIDARVEGRIRKLTTQPTVAEPVTAGE